MRHFDVDVDKSCNPGGGEKEDTFAGFRVSNDHRQC